MLQGDYFISQISFATSCWSIHCINLAHTANHSHTWQISDRKWQMIAVRYSKDRVFGLCI